VSRPRRPPDSVRGASSFLGTAGAQAATPDRRLGGGDLLRLRHRHALDTL